MAIDDESPLRVNTRGGGTVVTWIAHPLLYSFSFGALFLCSLLDWAGANGGAGSNAAGRRRVRRRGEPAVAAVAEAAAVRELLRPMQDPRGRAQERVQHVLPRLHERRALLPVPRLPPRPPRHPGGHTPRGGKSGISWRRIGAPGAGLFLGKKRQLRPAPVLPSKDSSCYRSLLRRGDLW